MIRCSCGKILPVQAPSIAVDEGARGRAREALYRVATGLGWIELSPGSWGCPPCMRAVRRTQSARVAS